MPYEDKTLVCVQCKKEFVFTAGEQQFFAERDFTSPPKRCKPCRRSRKRGKDSVTGYGEYRSPAFETSAPDHQKIRGRKRGGRRHRGGERRDDRPARGGGGQRQGARGYRSPAFRARNQGADQEYRAPGFKEHEQINPDEEYRAPGFKEYDHINPEEEYRAPGFGEYKTQYQDERPMFSIVCPVCGQEAMVPFLPEEKENPMCSDCYKATKEAEAAERLSASAATEPAATGGSSTAEIDDHAGALAEAGEAQSAKADDPSEDPAASDSAAS